MLKIDPRPGKVSEKMKELVRFQEHAKQSGRPVALLGVTGMDSSLLVPPLVRRLLSRFDLAVVIAPAALRFLPEDAISSKLCPAGGALITFTDKDEWAFWKESAVVLHIVLRSVADLLLLAPACPNTLAKLANGFCDDLLVF